MCTAEHDAWLLLEMDAAMDWPQELGIDLLQDLGAAVGRLEIDQKDFSGVLFHRVKKLRDVWVGLGVDVCEDTELECQMRLVEEIIEQREARNCRHNGRYVRTVVGTWRMVRYTHSLTELLVTCGLVWWGSVVVSW